MVLLPLRMSEVQFPKDGGRPRIVDRPPLGEFAKSPGSDGHPDVPHLLQERSRIVTLEVLAGAFGGALRTGTRGGVDLGSRPRSVRSMKPAKRGFEGDAR